MPHSTLETISIATTRYTALLVSSLVLSCLYSSLLICTHLYLSVLVMSLLFSTCHKVIDTHSYKFFWCLQLLRLGTTSFFIALPPSSLLMSRRSLSACLVECRLLPVSVQCKLLGICGTDVGASGPDHDLANAES
jgi:hypothetical protein